VGRRCVHCCYRAATPENNFSRLIDRHKNKPRAIQAPAVSAGCCLNLWALVIRAASGCRGMGDAARSESFSFAYLTPCKSHVIIIRVTVGHPRRRTIGRRRPVTLLGCGPSSPKRRPSHLTKMSLETGRSPSRRSRSPGTRVSCPPRGFPPLWTIEDNGSCFIVKDYNGRSTPIIRVGRPGCRASCSGGSTWSPRLRRDW
jgi:hypothetical protein